MTFETFKNWMGLKLPECDDCGTPNNLLALDEMDHTAIRCKFCWKAFIEENIENISRNYNLYK